MTLIERAYLALSANLKRQAGTKGFASSDDGRYPVLDGCFDMQDAARAVLEAIREPSEAMVKAGKDALPAFEAPLQADASDCWQAMIDAAIFE